MSGMYPRQRKAVGCHESLAMLCAVAGVVVGSLLLTSASADNVPNEIFGNYAGAGPCTANAPKPCTDTSVMDNIYIERLDFKYESEQDRQLRESLQQKRSDARVAIRVFHDYGHSCTAEGKMSWVGDHLEFLEGPAAHGTIPGNCRLQLWFKNGAMTTKDPGKGCEESFCTGERHTIFGGRHFVKGADQLISAPKRPHAQPPKTIFGRFEGTGICATDERRTEVCKENRKTDYIAIEPSNSADAKVTFGSLKEPGEDKDYLCLNAADATWVDNRLVFAKEMPETPGRPHVVEFIFKGDSVVVRNLWSNHCGTYVQGSLFERDRFQISGMAKQ